MENNLQRFALRLQLPSLQEIYKKNILSITGLPTIKPNMSVLREYCRAPFGEPSEPPNVRWGLEK